MNDRYSGEYEPEAFSGHPENRPIGDIRRVKIYVVNAWGRAGDGEWEVNEEGTHALMPWDEWMNWVKLLKEGYDLMGESAEEATSLRAEIEQLKS